MLEEDDLAGLGRDELLAELQRVREALEDLEEERLFTLGQTGVHLGAVRVAKLRASWDRDEARLKTRMQNIVRLLDGDGIIDKSGRSARAGELRAEIDDLTRRLPAHSVPQAMMTKLEELEDELARLEG